MHKLGLIICIWLIVIINAQVDTHKCHTRTILEIKHHESLKKIRMNAYENLIVLRYSINITSICNTNNPNDAILSTVCVRSDTQSSNIREQLATECYRYYNIISGVALGCIEYTNFNQYHCMRLCIIISYIRLSIANIIPYNKTIADIYRNQYITAKYNFYYDNNLISNEC